MTNFNLPLNPEQQEWLAGHLDVEIEYLRCIDAPTPDELRLLEQLQALERQLETLANRNR